MMDEGGAAYGIVSLLMLRLTADGVVPKETALGILRDLTKLFEEEQRWLERDLIRALAVEIDEQVPD